MRFPGRTTCEPHGALVIIASLDKDGDDIELPKSVVLSIFAPKVFILMVLGQNSLIQQEILPIRPPSRQVDPVHRPSTDRGPCILPSLSHFRTSINSRLRG